MPPKGSASKYHCTRSQSFHIGTGGTHSANSRGCPVHPATEGSRSVALQARLLGPKPSVTQTSQPAGRFTSLQGGWELPPSWTEEGERESLDVLRHGSISPGGQRGEGKGQEEAARGEDSSGGGWGSQEPHPPPEEPQTGFWAELSPLLLDLETSGPQHVPFQMMHTHGGGHGPATIRSSRGGQTRDSPGTSHWSQLGKPKRLHWLG